MATRISDQDVPTPAATRGFLRLARRVFRQHPAMPATAFLRAFEVDVVARRLTGTGRGLDVGCGDGSLARVYLAGAPGVAWRGLDSDAADARAAERSGIYDGVCVADARAIPEPDSAFDVVFANSVLEHIPQVDAVLAEFARVLRPGGRCAFTVPLPGFRRALVVTRVLRAAGLAGAAERYAAWVDRRVAHVHYRSLDEWRGALAAAGLEVTVVERYLSRAATGVWDALALATGGLAYALTGGRERLEAVQRRAVLAPLRAPAVGAAVFWAAAPVLAAMHRGARRAARRAAGGAGTCAYVEAVRRAPAAA